jgi:hypothetical protein
MGLESGPWEDESGFDLELDLDDGFEDEASVPPTKPAPVPDGKVPKVPVKPKKVVTAAPAAVPGGDVLPGTAGDPNRLDPPKMMKCRCGGDIPVRSRRRPLEVTCDSCGARATLKKKK